MQGPFFSTPPHEPIHEPQLSDDELDDDSVLAAKSPVAKPEALESDSDDNSPLMRKLPASAPAAKRPCLGGTDCGTDGGDAPRRKTKLDKVLAELAFSNPGVKAAVGSRSRSGTEPFLAPPPVQAPAAQSTDPASNIATGPGAQQVVTLQMRRASCDCRIHV